MTNKPVYNSVTSNLSLNQPAYKTYLTTMKNGKTQHPKFTETEWPYPLLHAQMCNSKTCKDG